jgi:hypothetical protein
VQPDHQRAQEAVVSDTPPQYPYRFILIYLGLGLALLASVFAIGLSLYLPAATHVVHKSDLQNALGETDYVKLAESEIQREANGYGLTVQSQRVVSASSDGNEANVVIALTFLDPYQQKHNIKLRVKLTKSVYSVKSVAQT